MRPPVPYLVQRTHTAAQTGYLLRDARDRLSASALLRTLRETRHFFPHALLRTRTLYYIACVCVCVGVCVCVQRVFVRSAATETCFNAYIAMRLGMGNVVAIVVVAMPSSFPGHALCMWYLYVYIYVSSEGLGKAVSAHKLRLEREQTE